MHTKRIKKASDLRVQSPGASHLSPLYIPGDEVGLLGGAAELPSPVTVADLLFCNAWK